MRSLQLSLGKRFKPHLHSQKKVIFIPPGVKDSLTRWTLDHNLLQGRVSQDPAPSKVLTTDASLMGWGAHLDGMTVYGLWTADVDTPLPHINVLEL